MLEVLKLDKFVVYPGEVRGGGNITSNVLARDVWKNGCDLDDDTATIEGVVRPVYSLFGVSDNYTITEVMAAIGGYLIKNLRVSGTGIYYDKVATSSITSMTQLNGIIYNIAYSGGAITFDTWDSSNTNLHQEDLYLLETAVQSLSYTDYEIDLTVVGEIDV